MIECECCGGWFHPDEIRECDECNIEICGRCFDRHMQNHIKVDEFEECTAPLREVPRECPKCGSELELDIGYDTTIVICPKCDFTLDATAEFNKLNEDEDEE